MLNKKKLPLFIESFMENDYICSYNNMTDMEQKSKRSSMTNSEIVSIIQKVLSMTESVVAQLKAEKKTKV